ncbi:hypothetical protein BDV95DRAFT_671234 [Massariosphaeria phaeospora]|uniref:Uncharacterized protein n=1 Tax=Massariosphaeria phaeospora TaxID=100035 RepID=A0A7C8M6U2_9PLEO|nr:hypothetical protein BDV95DRAFT_671234 [Massariosphaeria phaeospora]
MSSSTPIYKLSTEILLHIAKMVPTASLPALCRVSKELQPIAEEALYRYLVISSNATSACDPIFRLLKRVVEQPRLAKSVKSLTTLDIYQNSSKFQDDLLLSILQIIDKRFASSEQGATWRARAEEGHELAFVAVLLAALPNIRSLDIALLNVSDLIELPSLLRSLGTYTHQPSSKTYDMFQSVTNLSVGCSGVGLLSCSFPKLKTLKITQLNTLDMDNFMDEVVFFNRFSYDDLSRSTKNLEQLVIELPYGFRDIYWNNWTESLSPWVSELALTHVPHLIVTFCYISPHEYELITFQYLVDMIHEVFPSISKLTIPDDSYFSMDFMDIVEPIMCMPHFHHLRELEVSIEVLAGHNLGDYEKESLPAGLRKLAVCCFQMCHLERFGAWLDTFKDAETTKGLEDLVIWAENYQNIEEIQGWVDKFYGNLGFRVKVTHCEYRGTTGPWILHT